MSLAVLVDQDVSWEKDQNGYRKVLVPPAPEKLKVIRDLVAGITGFTESRGDQLVIETLPFETTMLLEAPQPATPPAVAPPAATPLTMILKLDRKTQLIAAGSASGVIVLLVVVILLMRRGKRRGRATATGQAAIPAGAGAADGVGPSGVENQIESKLAERDALQEKMDAKALQALKIAPVITKTSEVLAKHIREKVSKESEISAQILRTWIREEED